MAKRALESFVVALPDGKRRYQKDSVVPDEIAKGRDALVYDDGAPAPVKPKKCDA